MKNACITIAKINLSITALFLAGIWLCWIIVPEVIAAKYEVLAKNLTGMNMLKSDMGSCVLTIVIFIALYFKKGKIWLYPTLVCLMSILITRLISIVTSGISNKIWLALLLEISALVSVLFLIKVTHKNI